MKHRRPGDVGTAGKTFNNRPKLTGRTGAFKDRVTRELRRHTWNQINNQHEGKTRSQGAHGEQNHNKTVQGRDNIIVFQYIIRKIKCIKHYVMARFPKLGLLNYNSNKNECVP